jgi:hypothetical protein
LSHTTLNVEVDVVAKYVERLTGGYGRVPSAGEEARAE